MKKIYIAGPDVFRRNALAVLEDKKKICKEHGTIGLSPFDSEVPPPSAAETKLIKSTIAFSVYRGNLELIMQADVIVADLTPFRGPSLDSGTAFEIGVATALGKPVVGYVDPPTREYKNMSDWQARAVDSSDHPVIEDFGLVDNLMVGCAVAKVTKTFEEAVAFAKELKGL